MNRYYEPMIKDLTQEILFGADAQYIINLNSTDCPGFDPVNNPILISASSGQLGAIVGCSMYNPDSLYFRIKCVETGEVEYLWNVENITQTGGVTCPFGLPYTYDCSIDPSMPQECRVKNMIMTVNDSFSIDLCNYK